MLRKLLAVLKPSIRYCNIGGGPGFKHRHWLNLEAVPGRKNRKPFALNSTCRFPLANGSVELVYSSHALEHLETPTVARVVSESLRILQPDGTLVIKIPDFESLHKAWRKNDQSYFSDEKWNFPVMTRTFANRGVKDTINARAAYLFCGFWNSNFGNLFAQHNPSAPGAYHGPPVLTDEELCRILDQHSMNAIASSLRARVVCDEADYTFNHQNAWSESEFFSFLEQHGFSVLSSNKEQIRRDFRYIPGIDEMFDISSYFLARPTTKAERAKLWRDYDVNVREAVGGQYSGPQADAFSRDGYYFGILSSETADAAAKAIIAAPHISFHQGDYMPGYVTYPFTATEEAAFNQASHFCSMTAAISSQVAAILGAIKDQVAKCLGSPWKVVNVRCWTTPPAASAQHMYAWHSDDFVDEIFKVMVYLTPRTHSFGGIELLLGSETVFPETEEVGTWLLFKNSGIKHRGVPGTDHERISAEITLCRSTSFDLSPYFAGLNGHWPMHP